MPHLPCRIGACFTSVKQLRAHIDAFIETYNKKRRRDRRHRLSEQGGDLRSLVQGEQRNDAADRR
jgi:Integrase core domain